MSEDNDDFDFIDKALKSKKKKDASDVEERVKFLKEFAKEPDADVDTMASILEIPQNLAENYVKKYVYLMIHTANDEDAPRTARLVLNEGIDNTRNRITDVELNALKPLIDKYGDFKTVSKLREKQMNQRYMNQVQGKDFSSMMNEPNPHDFSGAHQGFANGQPSDVPVDKPYASLSNSGRSNLLRWVLERSPYIHNSKIQPFIQLFETSEMKYMSSPDELYRFMCDYFGPAAGKLAFNQFKDMTVNFLPQNQQFGYNPYGGQQWGAPGQGWGGQAQGPSFYEQLGVIPFGVNPRSPEALRAIYEFEQEKKQRKAAESMQENIKNYVNLKMMDIVDPNRQNGGGGQQNGNMQNWMQMAIMSGQMKITGIDPTSGMPMLQPNDTSQNSLAVGMMNVMNQMYQGVMAANSQTPKFMETMLSAMFEKLNTQSDPFTMAITAKKLADTFNPPGAGLGNGIEAAKILLARNKIESDKELTIQKMQFDHDKEMYEREKQDKQEENSNAQTQEIVKSIFSIGGQALVPLLSMFMGRNQPGGGMGALAGLMGQQGNGQGGMPDISAMMGGMQGGGIPGQEQEMMGIPGSMPVDMNQIIGMQQNSGNPEWMIQEPNPNFGPYTNMPPQQPVQMPPTPQEQWANFNPDQAAAQPQWQSRNPNQTGWDNAPQPQTYEEPEKTNYTVEDFKGKTLTDIESELRIAEQNQNTLDSFKNAARIAYQQQLFQEQNNGPGQQVTQNNLTQQYQQFAMPSNTPIEPPKEIAVESADESLIKNRGNVGLDPLDQAEELLNTNLDDLAVLPDTPESVPTKNQKGELKDLREGASGAVNTEELGGGDIGTEGDVA